MYVRSSRRPGLLQRFTQVNWVVVVIITLLACIGFAMLYSAAGGAFEPWANRQITRFLVAFLLMLAIAVMPMRWLYRNAYTIYALLLLTLVAVELSGFVGMGAQRWIKVGFVNVQPSEMMKIATILMLARYFHGLHPADVSRPPFLLVPLALVALPAAMILRQPNLGTATILVLVSVALFFMAGVKWRYFIALGIGGLAALPIGWQFLHDYQKKRVLTFLDPEQDPLGSGYNIMQSIIAIGSGGLFGKGFVRGSQGQLDFLPEKQTDFIFTMLAEEFGFIGSITLLLLYLMLIVFGVGIAIRCRNLFGALLSIGITAMLFVHIFINIAMVMGMIPVVGVPLPLLSYGGTMLITMMVGFGLMLNAYVNRDIMLTRSGIETTGYN